MEQPICYCASVSARHIYNAVEDGVRTFEQLAAVTGAANHCSTCTQEVIACLQEARLTLLKHKKTLKDKRQLLLFN